MTKKDYIRAADMLKAYPACPARAEAQHLFAKFFADEPGTKFNKGRFLDYVNGLCGPNGGKVTP